MLPTTPAPSSPRGRTNRKWKAAVLCAAWCLLLVQGFHLPALGQDAAEGSPPVAVIKAEVVVNSSPTGQAVTLDGQRLDAITPARLDLNPGEHSMIVNAEEYQPLTHEFTVAAGEYLELEFILLKTPPEPPTQEELRALAPPFGADDPNSDYWAEAKPRQMANESCRDCHSGILTLHASGEHRNLGCEDCHSALDDHVKDDQVIGTMQVVRGEGIQGMCMLCHDRNNRHRVREPARTVEVRQHLQELRVRLENRCEDCHHVHDPQKWVHEAREMVGLPEKMATIPMLEERTALEKKQFYSSMAEIFLVFPLFPGFMGVAVSDEGGEFPAAIMLGAGLLLVGTSYFLGNRAFNKELDRIRALNDERRAVNVRVKEHNRLVEKAMVDHERAISAWAEESEGRGRVVVKGQ